MRQNNARQRVKFITIGLIALLMLSACASTRSQDLLERSGATSPEDYILKSYAIPPMSQPVILSQRNWARGLLYLFTYQTELHGKSYSNLAFQLFTRNPAGAGWSDIRGAGFSRGDSTPPRSPLLDYEISIFGSESEPAVVVYGKALDPRANRVKIGYDQGDYLSLIDNGVFGEVVPKQFKLCSLSILAKDDQVLERIDLTKSTPRLPVYAQLEDCPAELKGR